MNNWNCISMYQQQYQMTTPTLYIIKSTFDTLDKEQTSLRMWKWHLCYKVYMKNVETCNAELSIKVTPEFKDKPYHERLQILNLYMYSMEYRRKRGHMIQAYNILLNIDRIVLVISQNIKGLWTITWNYWNLLGTRIEKTGI